MKTRYRTVIAVAVVLASLGAPLSAYGATAVERHGKLRTEGAYILNRNNKIVQLRGMSFYWATPGWNGYGYYNAKTVDALVDTWKCTVIRVAYDPDHPEGWSGCQTVIEQAITRGIYVIIDWHSHTAEQQESQAIQFFNDKADRYKDTPNVIFEIYNEPVNAGDPENGTRPAAEKTWQKIRPYLENVTRTIRDAGAENLILAGTPYYCQFVNVAANENNQLRDKDGNKFTNLAYVFHFYAASHGPNAFYKVGDEGGMEMEYLNGALGKVPIFVSEWGTTHSDGGRDDHTYVDEKNTDWWFDKFMNGDYHLSTCNWSASAFESSSAFASEGATSPSTSGKIVMRLLKADSIDEYPFKSDVGEDGPAVGTVAAMPATHPAHRYMHYFGANMNLVKPAVPFLSRDKVDKRTANDSCVPVLGTAVGQDWLSYDVKNSKATKYFSIRSRLTSANSEGKIGVRIDGNSVGTVMVKDTVWQTEKIDTDVAIGEHTIKLVFTTTKGDGFLVEWFELSSVTATVGEGKMVRASSLTSKPAAAVASMKNGIHLTVPDGAGYTGYRLFKVDGRMVRSGSVSPSVILGGIPGGVWFIELSGSAGKKVLNTMVSGRQ